MSVSECAAGTWGFRCANKCHCRNNIPCDFATGFCSNAQCADGWAGVSCFEGLLIEKYLNYQLGKCFLNEFK